MKSYIILGFVEDEDIKQDLKQSSLTNFRSEKEVVCYHAIFPDRIIDVFSQNDDEFCDFYINPDLYSVLKEGVPKEIPTEQINFDESNEMLGNGCHSIRSIK